jgi:hypothetical protein
VAAHSSSIREEHMLRVEASNLPKPRGTPRPRRLLPNPPMPRRKEVAARHELLPPADPASAPTPELALASSPSRVLGPNERWSVKLELGDEEIAKLYGQGMTRGAVVWKKGMQEWRPLLITPELSGLLRRTRITLTESPPLARMPLPSSLPSGLPPDELTLPRPPRLPSELPPTLIERSPIQSVAPTAFDIEPSVKPRRRTAELLGVGVAAFALAWLGHSTLHPSAPSAALPPGPPAAMAAAAPACEPARGPATVTASTLSGSSIPTVSIADLPLVGQRGTSTPASHVLASRGSARSQATSSDGRPSRAALQEALGQVARAASGCGERGGPVRVTLSFANSGVARSIQVSGTDLPAATRSCMISAASRARVPAFSGDPVTVAKTL